MASSFREYVESIVADVKARLSEQSLYDPVTERLEVERVVAVTSVPRQEWPPSLAAPLAYVHRAAAGLEYLGKDSALQLYSFGTFGWPHAWPDYPDRKGELGIASRDSLLQNQLPAAVCNDRVGRTVRARQLYEWAAEHSKITVDEVHEIYLNAKDYSELWERLPWRAYCFARLGRWEEAFEVAQEASEFVRQDRNAKKEAYNYALKILEVLLALCRYKLEPSDETRQRAMEVLDPQFVASRSHPDHLLGLFYLYNLRARHPELVSEQQPPRKAAIKPQPVTRLEHAAGVTALAFSPDAATLAAGLDSGEVHLWDHKKGKAFRSWSAHPGVIRAIGFSPDVHKLATVANRFSGSRQPVLRLWDPASGKRLHDLKGHKDNVTAIAFSADGSLLASTGEDRTARLWDVQRGRQRQSWPLEDPASALALGENNDWLAAGGGLFHGRIFVIPLGKGSRRTLEDHTEDECLAEPDEPTPDHTVTCLASGSGNHLVAGALDGSLRLWNVETGELSWIAEEAHSFHGVTGLAVARDLLISAGWDGQVAARRLRDGRQQWELKREQPIKALAASREAKLLALGFGDGTVGLVALP